MNLSRLILPVFAALVLSLPLHAQVAGPLPERMTIFSQNSISNIGAIGDTLWVGPLLSRNIANSPDWYIADQADSVTQGRGRMFSIALAPDTIVVGLGFTQEVAGASVQTAQGFYISIDGGVQWRFVSPPLDPVEQTSIRYGGQDIPVTAIVVPQQSPPFNVNFRGDTIFSAAWASGIRRSRDFGFTWERILLPPFELDRLDPQETYDFTFDPRTPQAGSVNASRYPRGWQNFLGFSVFIDRDGLVWAGTAGGVNISDNALTAPTDSIRWRHIRAQGRLNEMLGNWVIRIRENPSDGKIWLTNWITNSGEQQGLVATSDKGVTFSQHLIGERVNDVTFNGNYIFAAADGGLFISPDNGGTWIKQPQIRSANSFLRPEASFRSAAFGRGRVWIGSSDGLISTTTNGQSWQITRVDFPLAGSNVFQEGAPSVDSYAYPNPFSKSQHGMLRIRFRAPSAGQIRVDLMDFGMNRIRTLEQVSITEPGVYEAGWDGLDALGRRVANGPVFYRVTVDGKEITGKFLILN